jgi:two-component system OmpR family sensor kinase
MSDPFTHTELALLDALQRERRLLRQRELFNRIVLHEISNAVTVIMGTTTLLEINRHDPAGLEASIKRLRVGSNSLEALLKGLKCMISAETDTPERKSIDLNAFVRQVAADPAWVGPAGRERLQVEQRGAATPVEVCPALLQHALGNLMRNALAYGTTGQPVRVVLTENVRVGVCIHVSNPGQKLPVDFAAHAFEPGRGKFKTHPGGGMGFGLYIVRTCMQRSGGEVLFGSTPAITVFSLVLNAARLARVIPPWGGAQRATA